MSCTDTVLKKVKIGYTILEVILILLFIFGNNIHTNTFTAIASGILLIELYVCERIAPKVCNFIQVNIITTTIKNLHIIPSVVGVLSLVTIALLNPSTTHGYVSFLFFSELLFIAIVLLTTTLICDVYFVLWDRD